jgi:hypothetical protein
VDEELRDLLAGILGNVPRDRPVMEREIGGYEYRDRVFPEVPIRPGTQVRATSIERVNADGTRAPIDVSSMAPEAIATEARRAAEQGVVEQARGLATSGNEIPDVLPALRRLLQEIEAPAVHTRPSGVFDTSPAALERSFIEGVPQEPVEYLPVAQGRRLEAIRRRFTPERRRGLIDLADRMREAYPSAPSWYATGPLQ